MATKETKQPEEVKLQPGDRIRGLISGFNYFTTEQYGKLCAVTVEALGTQHRVILGSADDYDFKTMIGLKGSNAELDIEFKEVVNGRNHYRVIGFVL